MKSQPSTRKMNNSNHMESSWGFYCICFLILAAMNIIGSVEASKQFTVGDHKGWQQPTANDSAFYTHWASRKRFHIGDSLSFEYQNNDSVLVVEKWDYYHCNTNKPIFSFKDGNTIFNLDRPGLFYFISGAVDHCRNGQKLLIRVMGLHQKPDQSPPSVAAPPGGDDIAPGPHHSSGLVVTVTLSSVFVALMVTVIILVLKEQGRDSGQSSDENEGP